MAKIRQRAGQAVDLLLGRTIPAEGRAATAPGLGSAGALGEAPAAAAQTLLEGTAATPAATVAPEASAAFRFSDVGAGGETGKTIEARVNRIFRKLGVATGRVAKGDTTSVARAVIDRHLKELAAAANEKPLKSVLIPKIGKIRSLLIQASKAGATTNQIGVIASGSLQEVGALSGAAGTRFFEGMVKRTEQGVQPTKMLRKTKELTPARGTGIKARKIGRAAGPIAAYLLFDRIMEVRKQRKAEQEDIQKALAAPTEMPGGIGPMQIIDLISAMGPEAVGKFAADPALAIALMQQVQQQAASRVPQGAVTLRRSRPGQGGAGVGGATSADELMAMMGGQR